MCEFVSRGDRWRHRQKTSSFDIRSTNLETVSDSQLFPGKTMVLIDPDAVENSTKNRQKEPKRILHFSDGTLEEYSTDEEEEVDSADKDKTVVDPATLTWGPWFWYKTMVAGSSTLSYLDMAGEFLAGFFGITTPRYYFEMEEYKKREAEIQTNKDLEQGWSEPSSGAPLNNSASRGVATKQPEPVAV